MMGAAISLGGVEQRLLPEQIPGRFFTTAVLAHVLMWAGLVAVAEDVPSFQGGLGPVLTVVHVLTVGVLVPTAMGASLQMLPVALGRPAPPSATCHAVFALLLIGLLLLLFGFTTASTIAVQAAVASLLTCVVLYAATIAGIINGAVGSTLVRRCVLFALVALAAALLLAATLAINYRHPFLHDPVAVAIAHALLAAYGFMGLLALGFSQFLIPMFAIAEPGREREQAPALWLAVGGLLAAVSGLLVGPSWLGSVAAGMGLLAVALHVRGMRQVIGKRLRKRLGPEFHLIALSWTMLVASLLLGGSLAAGLLPASGGALWIFVVLVGWLLSLLTGVLQRVLPFLVSMNAFRAGTRPLAPTKLVLEPPLRLHRYCHGAAVLVIGVGIVANSPWLVRAGALVGCVGAFAFAYFAATVRSRYRDHLTAAPARNARRTGR